MYYSGDGATERCLSRQSLESAHGFREHALKEDDAAAALALIPRKPGADELEHHIAQVRVRAAALFHPGTRPSAAPPRPGAPPSIHALFDAAARADLAMVKALHLAGAAMDAPDASRHGRRPLHFACAHPRGLETVMYLVNECGCAVSWQDGRGASPLHVAARADTDAPLICAFLLSAGADFTEWSYGERTPLAGAAAMRNTKTVELLEAVALARTWEKWCARNPERTIDGFTYAFEGEE